MNITLKVVLSVGILIMTLGVVGCASCPGSTCLNQSVRITSSISATPFLSANYETQPSSFFLLCANLRVLCV